MYLFVHLAYVFHTLVVLVSCEAGDDHREYLFEAVFWDVPPFIYTDNNGKIAGIIPDAFHRAHFYCHHGHNMSDVGTVGFNSSRRFRTRREFHDSITEGHIHNRNKTGILEGLEKSTVIWAPILSMNGGWGEKNGYKLLNFLKIDHIAVIVRREECKLMNKFLNGILSCRAIAIIAFLFSLVFSFVIWLIERQCNALFPKSFTRGFPKAVWFSFVSMTTVGYGDVVAKTPVGRMIVSIWMIFGVLLTSILTATLTNVVSGVDAISLFNQTVAVLENSYEEKVVRQDYLADVIHARSYEEIIELVRNRSVYAGVMNENVTSWMQDDIYLKNEVDTPLAIVKKLPATIHVNVMISSNISTNAIGLIQCMNKFKDEIHYQSTDEYHRYLHFQTTYIEASMYDLIKNDIAMRVFVIIGAIVLVVGLLYDLSKTYLLIVHRKWNVVMSCLLWFVGRQPFKETENDKEVLGNLSEKNNLTNEEFLLTEIP